MKQFGDRPEFRTKLVRFRNNLAILQRALGSSAESEATLRATLDLLKPALEGPDPLPAVRWQVARVSGNLGSLLVLNRRTYDEASAQLDRAEVLLRKLTAEFPSVAQYAVELASVEYNVGTLAASTSHPYQAVAAFKASIELLEKLKNRFPELPAYRMKLALSQAALAERLTQPPRATQKVLFGRPWESLRLYEISIPAFRNTKLKWDGPLPAWIHSQKLEAGRGGYRGGKGQGSS